MEQQITILKGELMEEKLRNYFLANHYYVARGVDYKFENNQITDIDLFLYGRTSSLNRERINVDIKNKKSPRAFERILWAKGVQSLLDLDNCVVATTDRRESIRNFGLDHKVIILDGTFLERLSSKDTGRIVEEEYLDELSNIKSFHKFKNSSWKEIYLTSKSRLINELDFSGFNQSLVLLEYFLKKCFDPQKKQVSFRTTCIVLSHALIILDYILKDIAFLDQQLRQERLEDGFQYGNLGSKGVESTIALAIKIVDSNKTVGAIKKSIQSGDFAILKEYFSKVEIIKNLFKQARDFENFGFSRGKLNPDLLPVDLQSTLTIFLDHFKMNRKDFYDQFGV